MAKILELRPYMNAPERLREIADQMESGEIVEDSCTVVIGAAVYNFGVMDDSTAARTAVFDLNFAIYQLMKEGHTVLDD